MDIIENLKTLHILDSKEDRIVGTLNEDDWIEAKINRTINQVAMFDFTALAGFDLLKQRNRIIIQASTGGWEEYIIRSAMKRRGNEVLIEADGSYIDDLRKARPLTPQTIPGATPETAAALALDSSGWQVGHVEWTGSFRSITIEEHKDPYEFLGDICSTFGLEMRFRLEVQGNQILGRFVDLVKTLETFNGEELEAGKNLLGWSKTEDSQNIVTALICIGPQPEDETKSPIVVTVEDADALARWGRGGNHLWGIYVPETEDANMTEARLRSLGKTELGKRIEAAVSYEFDAAFFPGLKLGETVRIKDTDYNPPFYLEARIRETSEDPKTWDVLTFGVGDFIEYTREDLEKQIAALRSIIMQKASDAKVRAELEAIQEDFEASIGLREPRIPVGPNPPANPKQGDKWIDSTVYPNVLKTYDGAEWKKASPTEAKEIGAETPQGAAEKADAAEKAAVGKAAQDATEKADAAEKAAIEKAAADAARQAQAAEASAKEYAQVKAAEERNAAIIAAAEDAKAKADAAKADAAEKLAAARLELDQAIAQAEAGAIDAAAVDALQKATAARDAAVKDAADKLAAAQASLNTAIGKKADASTTYTKTEVNNALAGKVSTTTYTTDKAGIVSRLDTAETSISQNAQAIESKASQSSVDSVAGRISKAETTITQQADAIRSKAEQTIVDTLKGRVDTAESEISQQAGLIASKVDATYVETAVHVSGKPADGSKTFSNVLNYHNRVASVTGMLIIRTPIVPNTMTNISISGYNYVTSSTDIDLNIGFYHYSNGVLQHGFNSKGTFKIEKVQVGRDAQNRAVIMIADAGTNWAYPAITVDKAIIGYTTPPDSYKDGWTASFSETIPDDVTNVRVLDPFSVKSIIESHSTSIEQTAEAIKSKAETSTVNALTGRVSTAETTITQQATAIASKAEKKDLDTVSGVANSAKTTAEQTAAGLKTKAEQSVVNTLTGRVDTAESEISQQAAAITQRVTKTELTGELAKKEGAIPKGPTAPATKATGDLWLDTSKTPNVLNRWSGTAWIKVTPTTAAEVGAYSTSEGSTLAGRVSTAETTIKQHATAITSKAEQTVVNALTTRVSTAEQTISAQDAAIKNKAEISVTNGLNSRLQTAEQTISAHTTEISQRVAVTDFNALAGRVSTAETAITQSQRAIELRVSQETFDAFANSQENLVRNPAKLTKREGWSMGTIETVDFFGQPTQALAVTSSGSSQVYSDYFNVDPSKAYEVTMWLKSETPAPSANNAYIGLNGNTAFEQIVASNGGTSADSTNFYFWYAGGTTNLSEWTKYTGYILPVGFDSADAKGLGNVIFHARMKPGTNSVRVRFLNWSNTATTPRTMWMTHAYTREVSPALLAEGVRKNSIVSSINLTPESVKIAAEKISLDGDVDILNGKTRVKNFSFDAGQGGILTLGGQNNVHGRLQVLDANGDTVADLDASTGGFAELAVGYLTAPNKAEYVNYNEVESDFHVATAWGGSTGVSGEPSDDNDGRGFATPLATINEVIRRLPQVFDGTVNIRLANGQVFDERVNLRGFSGNGTINIFCASATGTSTINGEVKAGRGGVHVTMDRIKLNHTTTGSMAVEVTAGLAHIRNCDIRGNADTLVGVDANYGGFAYVTDCTINGCNVGVRAIYGGIMRSWNNGGRNRTNGIESNGGILIASGTQPAGDVANVKTYNNGFQQSNSTTFPDAAVAPPPPPPKQTTTKWNSTGGNTYRVTQGYWDTQWALSTTVAQGRWDANTGLTAGAWFFGTGPGTTAGKNIKQIRAYIKRESAGGPGGAVTVTIKPHGYTSRPSGAPSFQSASMNVSLSRGEGKWVTLPSSFHTAFKSGGAKGIGVQTTSTSQSYYARLVNSASIEITYEG